MEGQKTLETQDKLVRGRSHLFCFEAWIGVCRGGGKQVQWDLMGGGGGGQGCCCPSFMPSCLSIRVLGKTGVM